jgi:hypothetical protein
VRCGAWTSITTVAGRGKQHPDEEDSNQLEDAESDELEDPVQVKNGLAPFGALNGGVCEGDGHSGVGILTSVCLFRYMRK